jgi:hypothetical protein
MIGRQDILDRASEWRLPPEVVEKDYVLGWLLASIARNPETSDKWVFIRRDLPQEVLLRDV